VTDRSSAFRSEREHGSPLDAHPAAAERALGVGSQTRTRFRIYHLIKSLGRGGAEMLLAEGLRFGDPNRFRYRFGYFLPWKNAVVPALERLGATVDCFGSRNNLQILLSARRLARHLKRNRVDLLHCHLPVAGAVGRVAGRLAGIPVVYTEHNKQERYHPLTRQLNRLTWRWQERAIAVSADVAESIRAHLPVTVPVEVVLNGVDVERFRRDPSSAGRVRARLGIPADAPVVGTVAVFRTQKRLEDWIEAARALRARIPNVHFLLIGDGPLRGEVEAAIERSGIREAIHLPGLQEDVRPFLSAMDVYLMSSIFEGLPIALLEAMSAGCAPVCTAVGGIPEVIRSGENGLLVPPMDPAALASAAGDLLAEPGRTEVVGALARRTVQDGFSMERMVRQLEVVYLDVLKGPPDGH
jgi:L-malate glycosyltransferase